MSPAAVESLVDTRRKGAEGRARDKLTLVLAAVLSLCIIRLWLMPLSSSFWVDEMVTSFVVRQGPGHPSFRVAPQVPASLYYALPAIADHYLSLSEVAYRIPSVIALAVALFLIARLATALIHPDAGWFAVFACMAFRSFNYQAADARPYALGTCILCTSLWFLVRWFDSGRWRHAFLFVASACILWRIHLLIWPLYLVFALYSGVRLMRHDTTLTLVRVAGVFGLLGASLVPVLAQALSLNQEAAQHVVAPLPSVRDLTYAVKLGFEAGVFGSGSLLSRWLHWPRRERTVSQSAFILILGWWACQALALFAFSWVTGNSVFVPRYLSVALAGVGMMATAGASLYLPPKYWRQVAALFGLGVLLFLGRWNHLLPPHHESDWRAAASGLGKVSTGPELPVLCPSPFIEAKSPVWSPDYPLPGFLYSHLAVYDIHGRPYLLPFQTSPEAERFVADLCRQVLRGSPRFAIYGPENSVMFWRDHLASQPALAGWSSRRLGPFGDVEVVVFDRDRRPPRSRSSSLDSSARGLVELGFKAAVVGELAQIRLLLAQSSHFGGQALESVPAWFEPNPGLFAPEVKFVSRRAGYAFLLEESGAILSPMDESGTAQLRITPVGGNPKPVIEPLEPLPARTTYLVGNRPDSWKANVP